MQSTVGVHFGWFFFSNQLFLHRTKCVFDVIPNTILIALNLQICVVSKHATKFVEKLVRGLCVQDAKMQCANTARTAQSKGVINDCYTLYAVRMVLLFTFK